MGHFCLIWLLITSIVRSIRPCWAKIKTQTRRPKQTVDVWRGDELGGIAARTGSAAQMLTCVQVKLLMPDRAVESRSGAPASSSARSITAQNWSAYANKATIFGAKARQPLCSHFHLRAKCRSELWQAEWESILLCFEGKKTHKYSSGNISLQPNSTIRSECVSVH